MSKEFSLTFHGRSVPTSFIRRRFALSDLVCSSEGECWRMVLVLVLLPSAYRLFMGEWPGSLTVGSLFSSLAHSFPSLPAKWWLVFRQVLGPIRFAYRLEAQVKRLQRYPHGSRNLDLEILLDSILVTREFFSKMINIFLSILSGTQYVTPQYKMKYNYIWIFLI